MSKFKVGDRVRIVHTDYENEGLDVGTTHEIMGTDRNLVVLEGNMSGWLNFFTEEVELVTAAPTNTLTVGKTYTSANGNKWECLAVKGDTAWLAGVYGEELGAAYRFKVDGTPVCLETASEKYRIVFEPVRETVKLYVQDTEYNIAFKDFGTVELINGTPDWSTAKVEACE